jgi:membrane protein YqaA with SNARE-associated domain
MRLLALAGVIAITISVYSIRNRAASLALYGYPGIFLLSVLANATVILPAPGLALTFAMGAIFNPYGVALAAGAGATLGELTGYLAGLSGQGAADRLRLYEKLKSWTIRYGGWTILLLALVPNPIFDLAGAAAGALKMPLHKFLFWTWIGKTLKMGLFAYAGANSVTWLLHLLGPAFAR